MAPRLAFAVAVILAALVGCGVRLPDGARIQTDRQGKGEARSFFF